MGRPSGLVPSRTWQSEGPHRVRPHRRPVPTTGAQSSGVVHIWWLGQAGFLVEHPGGRLIVDPYLSDSLATKYAGQRYPHRRLPAAPVLPQRLHDVDLALHTHAHTDHLDPLTVAGLLTHNQPRFVAPRARREIALSRGIPAHLLVEVTAGDVLALEGARVEVVPAAHEVITVDDAGDHVFVGYVIDVGGVRVYHSGDCVPFAGQAELLAGLDVDVALLPVNGRDPERLANGVPGNFTVDEAVALCRAAGIPALVCHHFGLFDFNTVDPDELVTRLGEIGDGLSWTVPAVGAAFELSTRRNS